ncbi:MAG: hypothetical protein ACE5H2_00760 [Terriglobia bacterium]
MNTQKRGPNIPLEKSIHVGGVLKTLGSFLALVSGKKPDGRKGVT